MKHFLDFMDCTGEHKHKYMVAGLYLRITIYKHPFTIAYQSANSHIV